MLNKLNSLQINSIYDFDNAMNINELLCKFYEKIEEVVEVSNESIDILNWIKETGVNEEVTAIITQMVNDGTIDNLINVTKLNELKSSLEFKISQLETNTNKDIDLINNKIDEIENSLSKDIVDFKEEVTGRVDDLETGLQNGFDSLSMEYDEKFNELKTDLDDKIKIIKYVKSQDELKEALVENSIIYICNDITLNEIMYIPSNCRIIGKGNPSLRTIQNAIFVTKEMNVTGYDGTHNVVIDGITFDGNNEDTKTLTLLGIGHAKNIKITNCNFKNLHIWHMLEINGSKDVIVDNCNFENYGNGGYNPTEAIQLDSMISADCYPWGGAYDNTSNDNVSIINCTFENIGTKSIGNHSFKSGVRQTNIKIHNNKFNNVKYCIYINDIKNITITNNHSDNVETFFRTETVYNSSENINISNNEYNGKKYDDVNVDGRFVMIQPEGNKDSYVIDCVNINNNIIKNANGHAIGYTGNNFKITNNTVKYSSRNGIYNYGGALSLITNNIVTDYGSGYTGIKIGGNTANSTFNTLVNGNMSDILIDSNSNKVIVNNNIGVINNNLGLGELNNNY